MNKEVTFRQIIFMYIFISLSPILRQIPNSLAQDSGRSGYLGVLWSVFAVLPLAGVLISIIKAYPGLNFYEIMVQVFGKFLAKVFVFSYLIWIILYLVTKINAYAYTLQFTLMPKTKTVFFLIIMLALVYYALLRGAKTVFRFSEFTLGPIIFLFVVLSICALPKVRWDYLLPVSFYNIPKTVIASRNVIAVGGNIIIAVFFADKFGLSVNEKHRRKLIFGGIFFIVTAFIITVFNLGISGAGFTAKLPFPFYVTVKSISFFNIFERFEVIITVICIFSDFIAVSLFFLIALRCFEWLFGLKKADFLYLPLSVFLFYLAYFIGQTQFELSFFYKYIMVNINLIFQYVLPFFLAFISIFKRKKIQKQF